MKELIARYIQGSKSVPNVTDWLQTPHGKARIASYQEAHEGLYPELMEEVRGLAEGSGQDFDTLFALNVLNEIGPEISKNSSKVPRILTTKGCSDYHLMLEGTQAWGHNEDGEPAYAEESTNYFVASNITYPGKPSQIYLAFTYPGRLSGWAWGFNSHGIVQSVNALWDTPDLKAYIGVNFVARSMLDATSIADGIQRASVSGHAGGQHFNLGSIHASCNATDPCQVSVETSPTDVTTIPLESVGGGRYAHFNQYLHTDKPHIGDYESSVHRLARAAQYSTWAKPPMSGQDILTFLSDEEDPDYPVYRSNRTKDPYVSYTTTLFDLIDKRAPVYTRQPVVGNTAVTPDLVLDLNNPFAWPSIDRS